MAHAPPDPVTLFNRRIALAIQEAADAARSMAGLIPTRRDETAATTLGVAKHMLNTAIGHIEKALEP